MVKPCPHCGAVGGVELAEILTAGPPSWELRCATCRMATPGDLEDPRFDDAGNLTDGRFVSTHHVAVRHGG